MACMRQFTRYNCIISSTVFEENLNKIAVSDIYIFIHI